MIGVLTLALSALLALLLCISVANLLTAPRLGTGRAATSASVLIPARNEGAALPLTLNSLLRYAPPGVEVLVLDDESTDGTASVVRQYEISSGGRVRLLRGSPLPAGWLGKNWACHQLAAAARGELLIFGDADVRLLDDAVSATAAVLERTRADALSALPRQQYAGWWDRAVIPLLLHFVMLATLPLALVHRSARPSLVYANGQWLAIRRAAYDRIGGHRAVRADVVEDMALGRALKRSGSRLVAALGADVLAVRMYRTPGELAQGFGKNLYPLLGGSPITLAAATLLFLLATLAPLVLAAAGSWVPLALLVLLRLSHARPTRAGWAELLLHPVGALLAPAVALHSMRAHRTGRVAWKARTVHTLENA